MAEEAVDVDSVDLMQGGVVAVGHPQPLELRVASALVQAVRPFVAGRSVVSARLLFQFRRHHLHPGRAESSMDSLSSAWRCDSDI